MKKILLTYSMIVLSIFFANAQDHVVINELYGGGGNAGAIFTHDFIELYNPTDNDVDLTGWSVQYASANGNSWNLNKHSLTGIIKSKSYFLIQEYSFNTNNGQPLPVTPDYTGNINLSATSGKIILCSTTTTQTDNNPSGSDIVDKVSYGGGADQMEGIPAGAPSVTKSIERKIAGLDTDNNNLDFILITPPTPTNSYNNYPIISSIFPENNSIENAPAFPAKIIFNDDIQKGSGNILLKKFSDNSIVESFDVNSSLVTINENTVFLLVQSLQFITEYYFEIPSTAFKNNFNKYFMGINGNWEWKFTTSEFPIGTLGLLNDFNVCPGFLNNGFTQYSITGDQQLWECTNYGIDPSHSPTGSAPNGMQINGFSTTNVPNQDWLISPSYDLGTSNFPLLSFWSRTKFNGLPLSLKISTDYPGTGNPNNYTWTELNGKFPNQTSDKWTESSNISLASFKSSNTHFAFVYNSSSEEGARWILDDIKLINSLNPPPPSISISSSDIAFGYAASGNAIVKTVTITGNDIIGDISLTASNNFKISLDPLGPFSSSIELPQAILNNASKTIFVQYLPIVDDLDFIGTISISSPSVNNEVVNLFGTSIDPAKTLEIVNWNIEWFGSSSYGPIDKNQQQSNVETILNSIGADLYGLVEVVDENRLKAIVDNMPGYEYKICNYGSHSNTNEAGYTALNNVQKQAFVYRTEVFGNVNISSTPLLSQGLNSIADLSNPAYGYFASGRFPYMMTADVTLDGITKPIRFVLLHAKANTSPTITSYDRRKKASDTLHYILNLLYPDDNIIVLGDLNDDLDQSITDGISPATTSYIAFTDDNENFYSPTLALSQAGKKSTVSYNDMIDHVILSNEMQKYIIPSSTHVISDAADLVQNYKSTTSDHLPVFTRYAFDPEILPIKILYFNAVKANNHSVKLQWATAQEINAKEFVVERSFNGRNWDIIEVVKTKGGGNTRVDYNLMDIHPLKGTNFYRLKLVDLDNSFAYTEVRKVNFDAGSTFTLYPNPAKDFVMLHLDDTDFMNAEIQIMDIQGRILMKKNTIDHSQHISIDVASFSSGIYLVKYIKPDGSYMIEKFIRE